MTCKQIGLHKNRHGLCEGENVASNSLPTAYMFVGCAAWTMDYIFSWNIKLHTNLALGILW